MILKKKFNIKPINYAELNRLSEDFSKRFVPQQELSDEQASRLQSSHPNTDQSASSPVKIEAPQELPKNNTFVNQTEPSFDQLFELNNLKADLQAKDTTIKKLKEHIKRVNETSTSESVKKDFDEIETINIELEYRVMLVAVTPINKKKTVRFADTVTSSCNIPKHPVIGAKALCSVCNECLFDANHAMCLIDHVNSMNVRAKSASKKNKKRKEWKPTRKVFNSIRYKWKPTGRTFTLVGNACHLTRITATNKLPLKVPIPLEVVAPTHVVTRVYTRRPKVPKSVQNSKPKVVKSMAANIMEPGTSRGSDTSIAPSSSSLINCRLSKSSCGIWTSDAPSI
ncbi:hypothetical protein Tco_0041005 [Tanacetum coccineum]